MDVQQRNSEQENAQRLGDCVSVSPSGLKNPALIIQILYKYKTKKVIFVLCLMKTN